MNKQFLYPRDTRIPTPPPSIPIQLVVSTGAVPAASTAMAYCGSPRIYWIALIFSHRWAIEIFFRFFKHMLGCRHLLSHDPEGIEIQSYCAIIACLLISLWTGKKPTLRTYEMICFYFCGMAREDELMKHIKKLKTQSA